MYPAGGRFAGVIRVAETTTFSLSAPSNFVFVDESGQPVSGVTFQAGNYTSEGMYIKGVEMGSGSAVISATNYVSVTSSAVVVTN